jgi:ABC-type lipoprotein export system ATPase subunit
VATFCHNYAHDLPITVNDASVQLELLYIDDLVDEMLDALEGKEHHCEFEGVNTVLTHGGRYCAAPVTHRVTLGQIVELLDSFKAQPQTLLMPQIPKGSFVGIIGPNGSGKSTLLKTIYRAYKASEGTVYLNGANMAKMGNKEIARYMAVVSQDYNAGFDFSVMEIMKIGLYAQRTYREQGRGDDTKRCEDALDAVGMLPFKDRSFLSLSGGEKQKVLVASAFSREPELIVLTNPPTIWTLATSS